MSEKTHNKPELKNHRKELRKNLTPAEAFLWKYLQNRKLEGRKFRRQHSIKNYIVDFYCAKEKLIIELDGEPHMSLNGQEKR
ncbi:endonuclease domain-containing protein [Aquimarina sp. 2304DJ70-9]|uniref:endonuclease domain-containing protein n=1 Tax=Aquimarina penaris TaxID=3231044 RepID=UPI003461EEAD